MKNQLEVCGECGKTVIKDYYKPKWICTNKDCDNVELDLYDLMVIVP
ncbi:MAG: hypothetical protein GWN56_05740 [Nitrosopumilaceae archaeon]|nr:hypothetical protein [Nitrosopumilaceae archaeon]